MPSIVKTKENILIFILFATAVINAVFEIAIIKEFTVATNNLLTSTYLFFAFLYIFFGVGGYLAYRFFNALIKREHIRKILFFTGVFVLLALFSSLKIETQKIIYAGSAHIFFVCFAFVLLGLVHSLIVIYFSKNKSSFVGPLIAFSLAGLILGFFIEPYAAVHLGVNATCLLLGISLIALSVNIPFFLASTCVMAGLFFFLPVDRNLEELRTIRQGLTEIGLDEKMLRKAALRKSAGRCDSIFNGWSEYTKLDIFVRDWDKKIIGTYNYRIIWVRKKGMGAKRSVQYEFVRPEDKVLIIGGGAGKQIDLFPPERKSTKENTTIVEIDPSVVRFFKEQHPEYNDNIFNQVETIAADGRTVMDEMTGAKEKDLIIINAFKPATTNVWMMSRRKNYLFTHENISRCFRLLKDDGVLMLFQNNPTPVSIVSNVLTNLNVNFYVFNFYVTEEDDGIWCIYSSRSKEKLESIKSYLEDAGYAAEKVNIENYSLLTDDRPFMDFAEKESRNLIVGMLAKCLTVILCIALGIMAIMSRKNDQEKRKIFYFFLIGNGFFLAQLFLVAKFRSLFTHPLKTILIITAIFLSSVAIGSLLSARIKLEALKEKFFGHAIAVILVLLYFWGTLSHIPFSSSSYFLKMISSILIIAPFGVICGFFYPVGLLVNKNRNLGYALFLDGLGTCSAFMLFYIICALFGVSANVYFIAFFYLLALALVSK